MLKCGTRWGKTKLAVQEAFYYLGKPNARIWWLAPSWSEAGVAWRMFLEDIPHEVMSSINNSEKSIRVINGSWIWFKSAEEYEHLRAEGLDFAVLDEAARMKRDAWFECIRPRLTDKQGKALFLSTPKGMNWFYEIYMMGRANIPGWESFSFPTWTNPYIQAGEIDSARQDMPERLFDQEFGAEFLSDLGAVFRFKRDEVTKEIVNVRGSFQEPVVAEKYVGGVDLGKRSSFTVIFILDMAGHVVAYDRFKTVDWTLQVKRVANLGLKYNNARMLLDSTGIGDPIYDFLKQIYPYASPYYISAGGKRMSLIDNLSLMIEQEEITWAEIPELMNELQVFGIETTRTGKPTYEAPRGFNDDCVFALALAAWALKKRGGVGFTFIDW
uniref:Putative terminase n=1 Tax=viral metagenome TaxID=1070528 RepID=A0A6M3JBJ3_9ZZZZ